MISDDVFVKSRHHNLGRLSESDDPQKKKSSENIIFKMIFLQKSSKTTHTI
jgi:hypothetical protein